MTFRLVNLPEMEGRFQVFGIKENAFVKSIRMDGREVLDQVVEIKASSRIEGVEIVISPEGASVRGVVCQEENGPVVKGATVIIFPADIEKRFRIHASSKLPRLINKADIRSEDFRLPSTLSAL